MGRIADILQSRGDIDEALRILREELVPIFEQLGDVRERAIVMGKIAHKLVQKGDAAAARLLQEKRLEVYRRLADVDGIGAALWAWHSLISRKRSSMTRSRASSRPTTLCPNSDVLAVSQ